MVDGVYEKDEQLEGCVRKSTNWMASLIFPNPSNSDGLKIPSFELYKRGLHAC